MAPRPEVGSAAEELYASLGPWAWKDTEDERYQALDFSEALVGGNRLQDLEDIIRDTDVGPGWSPVMDVDRAPLAWLGWLAQFAGVRTRNGLSESDQRQRIRNTDGMKRGSPGAMRAAAQQYLTGTKYVLLLERSSSAWTLSVRTRIDETPDTAAVLAALMEQKPAGIILDYATIAGQSYQDVKDGFANYAAVNAAYANYAEMREG